MPPYNLKNLFNSSWKMPTVTRNLPNSGGTYQAPTGGFSSSNSSGQPLFTAKITPAPVVAQPAPLTGSFGGTAALPQKYDYSSGAVSKSASGSFVPPKGVPQDQAAYINPATGTWYTPQEFTDKVASSIPNAAGSVPTYATDSYVNPDRTLNQLTSTATNLNNARNDVAVGQTDPFNVGPGTGINYSPTELAAIRKAYSGIYDPALNDVFSRLKTKEDADKLAADQAFEMQKLAKQHEYTMSEKGLTGGGSSGATYIPGADPIVDSYVERINRGELASDVFKNIPGVANQALRDKVSAGMMATKYESAKALGSLDTINSINKLLLNPKLDNISGVLGQTGATSLWGEAGTAKQIWNQISSQLQLQGATLAKGQGAISDYERSIFKGATVNASRAQSDAEFRKSLVNMRGALSLASGLTVAMKVTDPTTGESRQYTLDRDGVIAAEKNGLMIEAIDNTVSN